MQRGRLHAVCWNLPPHQRCFDQVQLTTHRHIGLPCLPAQEHGPCLACSTLHVALLLAPSCSAAPNALCCLPAAHPTCVSLQGREGHPVHGAVHGWSAAFAGARRRSVQSGQVGGRPAKHPVDADGAAWSAGSAGEFGAALECCTDWRDALEGCPDWRAALEGCPNGYSRWRLGPSFSTPPLRGPPCLTCPAKQLHPHRPALTYRRTRTARSRQAC